MKICFLLNFQASFPCFMVKQMKLSCLTQQGAQKELATLCNYLFAWKTGELICFLIFIVSKNFYA
jgi:hypothetical protein